MKTTDTHLPHGVHKLSSVFDEIIPSLQPKTPDESAFYDISPEQEAQIDRLVDTNPRMDYAAARAELGIKPVDATAAQHVGNIATGSEIQR